MERFHDKNAILTIVAIVGIVGVITLSTAILANGGSLTPLVSYAQGDNLLGAATTTFDNLGWSAWMDRDDPSGAGDYEHLSGALNEYSNLCTKPSAVECQVYDQATTRWVSYTQSGQRVTCSPAVGLYCKNADNGGSSTVTTCKDYRVRFRCTGDDKSSPVITVETPQDWATINSSSQTIAATTSDYMATSTWLDIDSTLLGYWPLDHYASTGAYDNSSYKRFASFNGGLGASNAAAGIRGQGLSFDGVDDRLEAGTRSLGITSAFSISAWVRSAANNNGRIIAKHGGGNYGWMLARYGATQSFEFRLSTTGSNWLGGSTASNTFLTDTWYHVVATYDGAAMKVYINGVEHVGGNFPASARGAVNVAPASLQIGDDGLSSGNYFSGVMDEVMLFRRALSASEAKALYDSRTNKYASTLSGLANGQHGYKLYATDALGNTATTPLRTFTVSVTTACASECSSPGLRQCTDTGYRVCGEYDDDTCLEWGAVTNCSSSQVCKEGSCIASSIITCSDDCSLGARECYGTGYRTCGNYDNDNCSEWSGATACPLTQPCINGACSITTSGKTYYLSPTGSDATGDGSITRPWFTLNKAWGVVEAGDIIYMRGGTYAYLQQQLLRNKNGNPSGYIHLFAYPNEKPVLTRGEPFTAPGWPSELVVVRGNYLHVKGLDISGVTQTNTQQIQGGMRAYFCNNCVFESLDIHHNGGGMQLTNTNNCTVINSDFHHNQDPLTSSGAGAYGNADGMGIDWIDASGLGITDAAAVAAYNQQSRNAVNYVKNCRFWYNTDDGLDAWEYEGMLHIDNSWAWYNGFIPDTLEEAGDGNGFKLGITDENLSNTVLRSVTNCVSFRNKAWGFLDNGAKCNMEIYNNIAYQNCYQGYGTPWCGGFHFNLVKGIPYYAKNNIAYNHVGGSNAAFNVLTNVNHNSWDSSVTVTDADFVSVIPTGVNGPRKADGSLPDITFLRLAAGSDLIDKGVNVGKQYSGSAPDLGAFEYGSSVVTCSNDCAAGARECSGTGYRVCGNYDSDSCTEWSAVTACSSSQVCSNGACVAVSNENVRYVDKNGIDSSSRDGSIGQEWASLSYACSRVTTAGHIIHVNPGNYVDNNRCDLSVGVSIRGDSNAPPTITTSYTYGVSTAYGYIRLNSPAGTPVNGDQSISYINLNGNAKTAYRAIAVNFRSNVKIHHCNFSYFRLSGVVFDGTNSNWDVTPANQLPVGNEVHDCYFTSCSNLHRNETNLWGPGHIRPEGQSGMKIYNNVFYQKDQAVGYNADIIAGYQNDGLQLYNNVFHKNDIEGEEWNFFYEMHYHRGGIEIYNNTFYGASTLDFSGTIKGDYSFGGKIYNNKFITDAIPPTNSRNQAYIDVESFTYVNDLYIYDNYFKYARTGIHINNAQISMNNIWVYNNIIEGVGNSRDSYSNAILVESNWGTNTPTPIDNLHIYNNVLTAAKSSSAGILISAGGDITNLNIKNNIISGGFSHPIRINDRDIATEINGLSISNNIFYNNLNQVIYYSGELTYTNRRDANNLFNTNPLFIGGQPYDFRLTASSPARGAGAYVSLDKDYAGNGWGNPPSIGAYEYGGTTPACTNDCVSGARECSGTGYRTCGNYDSDSCTEWSAVTACSSSQVCSNGACVAATAAPVISFDASTPADGATVTSSLTVAATVSDASAVSSFVDMDNSLLLWLRLDGGAADSSSFRRSSSDGGVSYVAGRFGRAADGFSDSRKISVDPALDFASTDISVSFWVNVRDFTTPARQNPFGKAFGGDGTLTLEASGIMNFYFGSAGADDVPYTSPESGLTVVPNVWEHWVLVRDIDSTTTQWYKNGVVASPLFDYSLGNEWDAAITTIVHSTNALTIGDSYASPLNGAIDEFMIFGRALSASEVKSLYDAKANKISATFSGLPVGEHSYVVYAVDAEGNLQTATRKFTVSTIKTCTDHAYAACYNGDAYWYDSCDARQELRTDCASTQTCSNGVCVSTCTNDCVSGARECSGTGYRVCGNYDSDSCTEWSAVTACSSSQVCSNGACVASATCSDGVQNQGETGVDCGGPCAACTSYARTFYVSSSAGNDANAGTSIAAPWKTLDKVNAQTFRAGDAILFKRGDTFRGSIYQTERGNATHRITYGAYGTGNKPLILSSKELSSTSSWTIHSNNLWKTTATLGTDQNDISNLVFNNEKSVGIKKPSLTDCTSQGDFFYDPSTHLLYLYSTTNPGSYYTSIEACGAYGIRHGNFYFYNSAYITVQNLDFRYSSAAGIEFRQCDNIIVEHCDVSWIGGEYLDEKRDIRLGNGISLWMNNSNFDIRYNRVSQCYDAGISPQGTGTYTQRNINIYYNIISDCWYSYELFTYSGSTIDNVNFDNNLCINAGNTWSASQRPDKNNARHVMNWNWGGTVIDSNIRNNIFKNSTATAVRYGTGTDLKFDYNLYDVATTGYIKWSITYTTLDQWKSATSLDYHSISGNPLFVSPSDFHLQSNSPAVNKGVAIPGLTKDFDGKTIVGLPDIGAYEYGGTTPACTNDCVSGARECSGTGYRTCGNYDSDSCTEWSAVTACSSSQVCSNGACVAAPNDGLTWTGELLVNGGFETGDFTGWNAVRGTGNGWAVGYKMGGTVAATPQSGSFLAYNNGDGDASGVDYYLYQDADVSGYASYIDAGRAVADAGGWWVSSEYQQYGIDYARIQVMFLDANKATLRTYDTGYMDNSNDIWDWAGVRSFPIPASTRYVRVWGTSYEDCSKISCQCYCDAGSLDSFSVRIGYNASTAPAGDTSPPVISFDSPTPASGATVSSPLTIAATISDASAVSSFVDMDNSLLLWLRLDGGAADSSSFRRSSSDGGVSYAAGRFGLAASGFTETRKISVDPSLDFASTDMSISFWVRMNDFSSPARQNPFGKAFGGDGSLTLEPSGTMNFYFGSSGVDDLPYTSPSTSLLATNGVWEHWVIVRDTDTTTTQWYKNGALASPLFDYSLGTEWDSPISRVVHSNNPLTVGDSYSYPLNGAIDEFMIFGRALSAAEVRSLYDAKANKLSATFSGLPSGAHSYVVYAVDAKGNLATSGARTFTISTTATCSGESTRACTITNGVGSQSATCVNGVWQWSVCTLVSCNEGYDPSGNTCVISPKPIIRFDSPTPANGATVTSSLTIAATISDASAVSSFVDIDNSLLLWLRLDGGAADSSSFRRSSSDGGVSYAAGRFGLAASGFADARKISVDPSLDFASTDMSISFWVNVRDFTTPARQNPFGKAFGGDGTLTLEPSGFFNFYFGSSGADDLPYTSPSPSVALTPNVWEHWVIVRDVSSTTTQWYRNGVVASPLFDYSLGGDWDDPITRIVHSANPLTIGDSYASPLNGAIDEFMIFGRALSAAEARSLYDAKANKLSATFSGLANGEHSYVVYAVDAEGNLQTAARTFTMSGATTCATHSYASCSDGDVYWYNSCGVREEIRYDCSSTQTCSNGACVSSCTNDCVSGARECYGTGYRACWDYDGDACNEWSGMISCPSGQQCVDGACVAVTSTRTYYLSPTGSDASGDGSITNPWFTMNKAWSVVAAGDTIYMRGGTYRYDTRQLLSGKSGTAGNMIKIWAYGSEKPVINPSSAFTDTRGIAVSRVNYLHLKGLEIAGFEQREGTNWYNGIVATNVNHCIFERLDVHHNGFGFSIGEQSDGNLVLNSDFHHNSDPLTAIGDNRPWGGSDGLTIRVNNASTTNTISGCRMWWNSDDGIDLWANEGMIVLNNSWAFWNGFQPGNFLNAGDGNGFKLGPTYTSGQPMKRKITNNIAFQNKLWGFVDNAATCNMEVYNNAAYQNCYRTDVTGVTWCGGFYFYYQGIPVYLKNNLAYANLLNGANRDRTINNLANVNHNSWDSSVTVSDADFVSLDGAQLLRARKADGSLPDITFLNLAAGSDLIDKGVNVGKQYLGSAPDLGAFEYAGATCTNDCVSGARECSGNGYRVCGNYDSDPCTEWSAVTACSSTQMCSNGACVSTCTNDCVSGARECSGNGYRVCGNYDSDSCTEWSAVTACSSTQMCSNGACVALTCSAAGCGSTIPCANDQTCDASPGACILLEEGQGDCDCDANCAGSLVCLQLSGHPVTGDTDYCCPPGEDWDGSKCNPPSVITGALVADHDSADAFNTIPSCWIDRAKANFNVAYAHTSHGSQVVTGMSALRSQNPTLYAWADGSSSSAVLDLDDYFTSGDLGSEDSWAPATRTYLNANPDVNVVAWSWCSIVGHNIPKYLDNMDSLIDDYPNVRFIFMTGHLAGSCEYDWDCSSRAAYHASNEQIRAHVEQVDGLLFDFGDIDSYRPGSDTQCTSNDYLSDASCFGAYPVECDWSSSCDGSCAHSAPDNCLQKGKAFWWMLARMAGWNGLPAGAGANACS